MFKKLITNLPFNPSLINQVSFYSKRLKQEQVVRGLSAFFIMAAMVLQVFAVVSPPERSLAASSNDIIYGGVRTKTEIINAWNAFGNDVAVIYEQFGLTLQDIKDLPEKPNATVHSQDGTDYWSTGRNSLTAYPDIKQQYKDNQIAVRYPWGDLNTTNDDRFVYGRQLKAWDRQGSGTSYAAFQGTISKTKEKFWILADCGNFTKVGRPTPVAPTPTPTPTPTPITPVVTIDKTILNQQPSYKPGDTFTYAITYGNTVNGSSSAENTVITDTLDTSSFEVLSVTPTTAKVTNGILKLERGNLAYAVGRDTINVTVRIKDQTPSGKQVCNTARISSTNGGNDEGSVCTNVINPCPYDPSVSGTNNPNCTEPVVACSVVDANINLSTRKATLKTTAVSSNQAQTKIVSYTYDFGDGSQKVVKSSSAFTDEEMHTYPAGEFKSKVVIAYTVTGVAGTKTSQACEVPIKFDKDAAFGQAKTVRNITKDKQGDAAVATKVSAGDVLEYTLTTTNTQNYERKGIEVNDYIGDLLDYASLDEAYLREKGGSFDTTTKKVVWKNVTLAANSQSQHVFKVTLKNPVPTTNIPSNMSTNFDCKMSNAYGNEITLSVNCPLVKAAESLPNTGPGTSLAAMSFITVVVGYFFARARLFRKELVIIQNEFNVAG